MRQHGSPVRGGQDVARSTLREGRFGRMFRKLPPCPAYGDLELTALADSMREQAPAPSGWTPSTPVEDGDNAPIPAGHTYFGQFLDHDITFDPASSLQKQNDPDALVNFRSPRFDLDSVYGSGPDDEPFQYATDGKRLLTASNAAGFDELPRNANGVAIIGDPRNDENSVISQMQLAFIRLHNRFVEQVDAEGALHEGYRFAEAQKRTRWTYQWLVVNDYLPRLIGRELLHDLYRTKEHPDKSKRRDKPEIVLRHYRARTSAYMPVEFSAAAFRFGHSQIRDRYALNGQIERPLFTPGDAAGALADLRGGQQVPADWQISWPFLFDTARASPQPSRRINTTLSASLFDLPGRAADQSQSLAFLNMRRGQALSLPSGQSVAAHMGNPVLEPAQLTSASGVAVPVPTPLWYYLLKEAEVMAGGAMLGPSGGRIVGEVLLGLLEQDPASYHNVDPLWHPEPPLPGAATKIGDVLQFAVGAT